LLDFGLLDFGSFRICLLTCFSDVGFPMFLLDFLAINNTLRYILHLTWNCHAYSKKGQDLNHDLDYFRTCEPHPHLVPAGSIASIISPYPSDITMRPTNIAPLPMNFNILGFSDRRRVPIIVPIRMLISLAGAM
jgi:hypothetical protein